MTDVAGDDPCYTPPPDPAPSPPHLSSDCGGNDDIRGIRLLKDLETPSFGAEMSSSVVIRRHVAAGTAIAAADAADASEAL
jgi:hypothetical protein